MKNLINKSYFEALKKREEMTDDIEMVSDCCGEPVHEDYDICSSCNDHCGSEPADLDDFDFDAYCESNPDFNAALNGHPNFI